jgi:hypothetical protein
MKVMTLFLCRIRYNKGVEFIMTFLYQMEEYPTGLFQVITHESDNSGEIIHINKEGRVTFIGSGPEPCDYLSYKDTLSDFSEFYKIE